MHPLALVALLLAAPAAPTSRTFDLRGHGQLVLAVPEGWTAVEAQREAEPWPTLQFRPREKNGFSMLVSPMFDPGDSFQAALPPAGVRRFVQRSLEQTASSAAEKDLALQELGGPLPGWLFTATDPAPKAGEWTHVTQGAAALGPLALFFSVLTNGKDVPERALALEMIRGARHVPEPRPALAPLALRFPDKSWALEVDLTGFQSGPVQKTGSGGVTVFASKERGGLVASVFLEPAEGPETASAACEHYLGHREESPYDRKTLKRGTLGALATVEYLVPEVEGVPLRQKNVFACLARDGVWVELHLSKAAFEPADQAAFERILKTVRITGGDEKQAD